MLIGIGILVSSIPMSDPSPVIVFAAPTLALCTTNFLSPNCIPFRPWIACHGKRNGGSIPGVKVCVITLEVLFHEHTRLGVIA